MHITESSMVALPRINPTIAKESTQDARPRVIFSDLHIITANSVTRNKTYYPSETLIGMPDEGTGAISLFYPYPIPVIRDHLDSPGFLGGEASIPYGRVYNGNYVSEPKTGGGYLQGIAAITDPWGIEMVMSKQFFTLSLGCEVKSVKCSICDRDLVLEGFCEHGKGDTYDGQVCYWKMGNMKALEVSFVNVPSDVKAHIKTPTMDISTAKLLLAGTDAEYLFDVASGSNYPMESYVENTLGISKKTLHTILESAERLYETTKYKNFGNKLSLNGKIRGL